MAWLYKTVFKRKLLNFWSNNFQSCREALIDLINGTIVNKVVFVHGGVINAITDIVLPKLETDSTDKAAMLSWPGNCSVFKLVVDAKPDYISYIDFCNV